LDAIALEQIEKNKVAPIQQVEAIVADIEPPVKIVETEEE
jgi:hypothetical protein